MGSAEENVELQRRDGDHGILPYFERVLSKKAGKTICFQLHENVDGGLDNGGHERVISKPYLPPGRYYERYYSATEKKYINARTTGDMRGGSDIVFKGLHVKPTAA